MAAPFKDHTYKEWRSKKVFSENEGIIIGINYWKWRYNYNYY